MKKKAEPLVKKLGIEKILSKYPYEVSGDRNRERQWRGR